MTMFVKPIDVLAKEVAERLRARGADRRAAWRDLVELREAVIELCELIAQLDRDVAGLADDAAGVPPDLRTPGARR